MKNAVLSGRKLLIMGGTSGAVYDILQYAQSNHVYTIVADNIELSPAKLIADESWLISTAEIDKIVELAKETGVDGVIAGISEFNIERAMSVCHKLGLPFYASREQWNLLSNKSHFKQLCRDNRIRVPEQYAIEKLLQGDAQGATFPVLIKPVDSSGGRGVYICAGLNEVAGLYEKSREFSKNGQVLVERYVTGQEVTIFYVAQDGEVYLTAMADRHTQHRHNEIIPLPVAYIFPSQHLEAYQETLHSKVTAMFKSIGIRNGVLFIQSFVEDGEFIFYEMGFRLTGTLEYKILLPTCGFNPLEMMVDYSLTGQMGETDLGRTVNPNLKTWACNVTFLARPGKIGKIIGVSKAAALTGVIDVVPVYKEGDIIPQTALGTLKQVIIRVFAVAESQHELGTVMDRIHATIKVISDTGENMLLPTWDTQELLTGEVRGEI